MRFMLCLHLGYFSIR